MPRRHVVGLSIIAAIAVVLTGSIVVRALPLGPDAPATTPGAAQIAAPVALPARVASAQAPAPAAPPAVAPAAGTPTQLPAPPPPMRSANPRRQIASIRERPQPASRPPHHRGERPHPRAQQGGPPPPPNDHPHPRRPHA